MSSIREILDKIRSAPSKEYEKVIDEVLQEILRDEFGEVLKKEDFGAIVELIIEIPEDKFGDFVSKFKDILNTKFSEAKPSDIGRLYEGITKQKRKIISINFRPTIVKRLASFSLEDIIRMLYNVVPATRETVLSQYKEIMMRPDFAKVMLETPLEILAEFLSLSPSSIRTSFVKRHTNVFTSPEFIDKLKRASADDRAMFLRWLPENLSRQIMQKLS